MLTLARATGQGTNLALVKRRRISTETIARLPLYLRCLNEINAGQLTCSSDELAAGVGVNAAQVRKDLSYFSPPGVRGVGYRVDALRDLLRTELGLTEKHRVAIAGVGNLGRAILLYPGCTDAGFDIVVAFDTDPLRIGATLNGIVVDDIANLERVVREKAVTIGIIATPAGAAQAVADRFVAAGVRSVLNFAPSVLKLRSDVQVRRVDLSTELQILSYHQGQLG